MTEAAYTYAGGLRPEVVVQRIKFADIAEGDRAVGDVIKAIPVKANTAVLAAGVRVVEASTVSGAAAVSLGATTAAEVSGTADPDRFLVSTSGGVKDKGNLTPTAGAPLIYNTDGTVDVTLFTAAPGDALVIDVWAVIMDLNYYETERSVEDGPLDLSS